MPDLLCLDRGVVDGHIGALSEEVTNEGDGGGFTSITGVSLEGKAENGNVLNCNTNVVSILVMQREKTPWRTLPVMVLKSVSTTVFENLLFWYSLSHLSYEIVKYFLHMPILFRRSLVDRYTAPTRGDFVERRRGHSSLSC